ncbi:copper ion binding protein (plasmid) [Exiguobacterium aurantiacum]|uniref:heavy-metal-associated domain-containing protein n=1 Tax=Exiguobacterium aurantiacum TaxID=33987 RepID=UPI00384AD7DD
MKKTILTIKGMTCAHCVNKIEGALQNLEGVKSAKVNLQKGTAKVKYDEVIRNYDDFSKAVEDAGYELESAK